MNRLALTIALMVAAVGCSERTTHQLGAAVDAAPISISSAQKASSDATVAVRGTMTKKCPIAGCWFVLNDATGSIKVDTKAAGFVVVDVPLKTTMIVTGRITTNDSERVLDATGVRY
jgi:uncharacterized protein YdeI (BOF family)